MRSFALDFLLLSLAASGAVWANIESENYVLPPNAILETVISTEASGFHIEADRFIPGYILFSEGSSVKTSNTQITSTIAGSALEEGFVEGAGKVARFRNITGFVQIYPNIMIVADNGNLCLRVIIRVADGTGTTTSLYWRITNTDRAEEAPRKVIRDAKYRHIIVVIYKTEMQMKELDIGLKAHKTIQLTTSNEVFYGLTQDLETGDFYTVHANMIYRRNYNFISDKKMIAVQFLYDLRPLLSSGILCINQGTQLLATAGLQILTVYPSTNDRSWLCWSDNQYVKKSANCSLTLTYSLQVVGSVLYFGQNNAIKKVTEIFQNKSGMTTTVTKQPPDDKVLATTSQQVSEASTTIIIVTSIVSTAVVLVAIAIVVACYMCRSNPTSSPGATDSTYNAVPMEPPKDEELERHSETGEHEYDEIYNEINEDKVNEPQLLTDTELQALSPHHNPTAPGSEEGDYLDPVQNEPRKPDYIDVIPESEPAVPGHQEEVSGLLENETSVDHMYTKPRSDGITQGADNNREDNEDEEVISGSDISYEGPDEKQLDLTSSVMNTNLIEAASDEAAEHTDNDGLDEQPPLTNTG